MKDTADARPDPKPEGTGKVREFLRRWWPAVMVGLGGIALSSVYYITAVQAFQDKLHQPAFVYLGGGLTLTILPGAVTWLVMRYVR